MRSEAREKGGEEEESERREEKKKRASVPTRRKHKQRASLNFPLLSVSKRLFPFRFRALQAASSQRTP